ncbi:GatB/YqeY domain-containing protein [Alkalilimnicola sp. S0819]|uniref:GatB/YqeY domain-containing protein n=1 Tax=Alkalilimnicola sp. S0819 TaxID=2613922 RepID=UPI0012627B2B|nr:GatB/YqeY domain-containing protein [Alkalilimnicola sp. S0819]KAB7627300.1 GatB/YqeY domain-containing protein [Alkalilimnicola sp. S0819]MPQ16014.1 GatB/YqeY domain-containing protein [Alkalilimnicola sp. S0819]
MSELKARITDAVKTAMKAGDKTRLVTLRMITAAIKQREVDERQDMDDAAVLAVLTKMVKQRREAAVQYRQAQREDLAAKELAEVEILNDFLPQPLSDAEVEAIIDEAIRETGAGGIQDMGKVMGVMRPKLQGRADLGAASARVKAKLTE